MEHCSMDPYEQQLLSVFDSYDIERKGSLDRDGLVKLCNTLQLEEQGSDLIKCLLPSSKLYVTFNEFKEGLLALLGNLQNQTKNEIRSDSESESPDRELSPKFVYGSKKYGRRSKPEEKETSDDTKVETKVKNSHKVQRSNSQSDVIHSKKRKTNNKLKRCTSFPGNPKQEHPFTENEISSPRYYNCSFDNESLLRDALERLGIGQDGYLNQYELVQVCESIGLHKISETLIHGTDKNQLDYNKKISVEELLEALQKQDDSYNIPSPVNTLDTTLNNTCITEDSLLFPNNKSIQYISLGPDGSGVTSSQNIVEMWENAGIQSAANLLQELGFSQSQINISELGALLEDELRTLNDSRSNISYTNISPQVVLLQATITLYQSEVKYLKSTLEQMNAEREKLRCDIAEANYRSSLLAQEIDENHAKMEKNTQSQVRLLEQRHAEVLKELTSQFTGDKEQMSILNSKLEKRISSLENEESKLKSTIHAIENYNNTLEKDNQALTSKISEMEHIKNTLSERVTILENECRKITELEREREQLEPLLVQITRLQQENSELRDKNDELCTEVENLSSQISTMRVKMTSTPSLPPLNISSDENISVIYEGIGAKRRVDSPSKDIEYSLESESPRLGKVRKYYKNQGETLHDVLGPFNNKSESGFEAELEFSDNSLSINEESIDEVKVLKQRIAHLEKLLLQNSVNIPEKNISLVGLPSEIETKEQLTKRCQELEAILGEVQTTVYKMLNEKTCEKECNLTTSISELSEKLQNVVFEKDNSSDISLNSVCKELKANEVYIETELNCSQLQKELQEKTKSNSEIKEECDNLQQALELLRNEFEHCENYWSSKLDEERQIFEQEQKQSSEKLNELLVKISEYEEQFTQDGRLPPIEENECLEKQYVDLEDEYLQYKTQAEDQLEERDKKITLLQEKLDEYKKLTSDEAIQVTIQESYDKINNLSNVIESSNIFSSETLPHLWNPPQIQSDSVDSSLVLNNASERDYTNPAFMWNNEVSETSTKSNSIINELQVPNESSSACNSLPASISWQPPKDSSPQPHSLSIIPDNVSSNTYRVKRGRKHDRNSFTSQHKPQKKDEKERQFGPRWNNGGYQANDQTCVVSINSIHHLHRRLHELDQHCRHLQFILKQQQQHSEAVMYHCWKQYRDEINEMQLHVKTLQEKLSRSDMLIKDFYVENNHLIASNQRLEQQCHKLIQSNSESTSV